VENNVAKPIEIIAASRIKLSIIVVVGGGGGQLMEMEIWQG
jgi:hypothetical protein